MISQILTPVARWYAVKFSLEYLIMLIGFHGIYKYNSKQLSDKQGMNGKKRRGWLKVFLFHHVNKESVFTLLFDQVDLVKTF